MNKEVLDILESLRGREGEIHVDDLPEDFDVEVEGDWISEGKYEVNQSIIKHTPSNTYWEISGDRSGSYYTDWYYGKSHISQVVPVEEVITITKWVAV